MTEIAPYKFHKIWDTPALNKLTEKCSRSSNFQVGNLYYRFLCLVPGVFKEGLYFIGVECLNPPPMGHMVTIKVKLLHKKPYIMKDFQAYFTNESKTHIITEGIPEKDVTRVWNKGKLGIDVTIEYTKASPPKPVSINYRELTGHVGLVNQASTCYMNSVLEMLFYIPAFRKLIFSIPNSTGIPLALQQLFTLLQLSPTSPTTTDLIKSFGWTNQDAFMQHDIQEFIRVLLDNLEEKLNKTELRGQLGSLLSGETAVQIKCVNSEFKKETPEIFYDLTLTVKGKKDVYESLAEICEDELFTGDNQYEVEAGHKEDAIRSTRLKRLPPILMFHLVRFQYSMTSPTGMEKVTDRYEYPTFLDLGPYTDSNGPAEYDLLAVLVHLGGSWGGHYIAFCKSGDKWFKFNDEKVESVSEKEAVEGNYGDARSGHHAYYLCYVKRSEAKWVMDESFDIPKFLKNYYEEKREDLDPSMIAVRFANTDKRVLVKKTALVQELSQKELWKVDGQNFPIELLDPKKQISEYFERSAAIYEADFDTKSIAKPKVFDIAFFSRKNTKMIDLGLKPFNEAKSVKLLGQTICELVGIPESTSLSCFDGDGNQIKSDKWLSEIEAHRLIFQPDELSVEIKEELLNENEDKSILKIRNLIPEIVLDTVPRFINHVKRCVHVVVSGIGDDITIEMPDIMPLKILIMCIRKSKGISDEDGVAIYAKEGSDILNTKQSSKLREALDVKEQFSQFMNIKCFVKLIKGKTQAEVDSLINVSFDVCNDMFDKQDTFSGEVSVNMKLSDLLQQVSNKVFKSEKIMRIIEINHCRITKIFSNDDNVSQIVNKTIRAEVVPEDQIGKKLLPIAFSINPQNPMAGAFLSPFLMSINEGETFDLTESRIMSMITTEIEEFNYFLFLGSRYARLQEFDSIDELTRYSKSPELFLTLTQNELQKFIQRNNNQSIKILN